MAAKGYSAGAIFLQVVPVFANVQRAIEDEAKNWDRTLGDQMEKSGEKAGERAGKAASKKMTEEVKKGASAFGEAYSDQVGEINKALQGINTNRLSNDVRKEVAAIRKEIAALSGVDITADADFREVYTKLGDLEKRLAAARDGVKIVFRSDVDNALRGIKQVRAAQEGLDETLVVKVEAETKKAEREIGAFERGIKKTMEKAASHVKGSTRKEVQALRDDLIGLGNLRIGVDISANRLRREVAEITGALDYLSHQDPEIDVRVDTGKAFAELAAWEAALRAVDGQDIENDVRVNTSGAQRNLLGFQRDSEDSANAFRSFNAVLLAGAGAGPALIPVLGAIAGGLLAIGPASAVAALGLGSVLVGFSGIGDAYSALSNQEAQSATTAQTAARSRESAARAIQNAQQGVADAERTAARAAEDAAEAVADAREQAAERVEDALERQKDAQEAYRDSLDDVRDAEKALAEARREAAGMGDDINDRIADNQLAQDQGLLDVFNATVTYDATMADGSATNAEQEQARINLEQARRRLEELREEQKELAKEKRKWDREGVNGTEQVETAQERLNDAIDAQKDSYEALRDAAKAVDEARRDGAEQVSDAIERQNETLADNARAVADAKAALDDARSASDQVTESVNAQQQAVDNAMDALGPAGRRFALFLFAMRDDFYAFRDDIQAAMLPSVMAAIQGFFASDSGAVLRDLMIDLAGGFGDFVQALSRSFQGPVWLEFFQTLDRIAPRIMEAYGSGFISFLEAMASIMTTLAPYAVDFAEGFARMAESFNQWAQSEAGQAAITGFMDHVAEIAPQVIDFFMAFGGALVNVIKAIAPYAEVVMRLLTDMLEYIAQMDSGTLGAILSGVLVLITASQLAYSVMTLLMSGAALLTSTIGVVVFALAAIGLAVAYLWHTNEDFRDFIKDAWAEIGGAVKDAWNDDLKPALSDLWDAVQDLWDEVLQPFFSWLAPIIVKLAKFYFPLLVKSWALVARGLGWAIRNLIIPAFKITGATFKWLWEKVARPVFNFIKVHWRDAVDAMVWVWKKILRPAWNAIAAGAKWLWDKALKPAFGWIEKGWNKLGKGIEWVWEKGIEPIWDFMADKALPKLKGAFRKAVDAIGQIWNDLKRTVGAPIKFVLDTIINEGLIDGFNKVAKWVGKDGFDHIPIPGFLQNYATGGVLPGYTPGQDVHHFVSPTGGRLNLSGGEAIIRPEATRVLGKGWVDEINGAAMSGGISGVKRALGLEQSFAKGGIVFPVPKGWYVEKTAYNLGHDGMDINHPNDSGPDGRGGTVPFMSATGGQVSYVGYGRGYGLATFVNSPYGELVYGHAYPGSTRTHAGQPVAPGQVLGMIGTTGNSSAPHLHFGYPGGTFYAAQSLLSGSPTMAAGDVKGGGRSIPGWIKSLLKNPLSAVKDWVSDKWAKASDFVNDSPAFDVVKRVPLAAAGAVKDKVLDIMPGWAKALGGAIGNAADAVGDVAGSIGGAIGNAAGAVGDALGYKDGGILPYNGTMMYDDGGYLPPGLTSVVNLTGKPEPVFTADQFATMGTSGGQGGNIHYEPHFEGSNLGPEDVAADLNFTFRRIKRGGKYQGVGQ